MTNKERARRIVIDWDNDHRWRAEENFRYGPRFPSLQKMIEQALDEVSGKSPVEKEAADRQAMT